MFDTYQQPFPIYSRQTDYSGKDFKVEQGKYQYRWVWGEDEHRRIKHGPDYMCFFQLWFSTADTVGCLPKIHPHFLYH